jgi:hypothetical protein
MKKKYQVPTIDVVELEVDDIITNSCPLETPDEPID